MGLGAGLLSAAMSMQAAEVPPTERQIAACAAARSQYDDVMQQWATLKASVSGR